MSQEQALPSYRRELGDGLVQRWSSSADTEDIAYLLGVVWRVTEDELPSPRVMDLMRRLLRGDYPLMGSGDFAVIEDTWKREHPIVACTCLWHVEWSYDGIILPVGQPENAATDPAYRRRGLIRALFEMIHARSAAEGHLVQVINGIPCYYRQFGYEYALDLYGWRVTYLVLVHEAEENGPEPYTLRPAVNADLPTIMALYNIRRATSLVWMVVPQRCWLPTTGFPATAIRLPQPGRSARHLPRCLGWPPGRALAQRPFPKTRFVDYALLTR